MKVQIKLNGPLVKYAIWPELHWINIRPGLNIEQLLNHIKIPRESVGLITVNGLKGSLTDKLKENDVISIFPHVSGG